uniref:Uncharacterized protein n=1 Tax=Rhizophora mucronata TaxID=61149 RepID=A0A2P2N0T9_RHIMU
MEAECSSDLIINQIWKLRSAFCSLS